MNPREVSVKLQRFLKLLYGPFMITTPQELLSETYVEARCLWGDSLLITGRQEEAMTEDQLAVALSAKTVCISSLCAHDPQEGAG